MHAAGGSDASARFCGTSGWRSRCTSQRPSTTALVRRWSHWWRGLKLCTTPYGDRSSLHRGCGRAVFPTQQVAATVGYVAAWAPRLTPVVLVQDAALDDKTVAWLLERSLAERQREEEEAEEAEVVKKLEDDMALKESRLLEGRCGPCDSSHLGRALQG